MRYFIGIDGGGSKTELILGDETGQIAGREMLPGTPYRQLGAEAVCGLLAEGVGRLCGKIDRADVAGACFGMSCYGEHIAEDEAAAKLIESALSPIPMRFENDVACAWAGSLAFKSGIIILSGTGSMAWGCDIHGGMHRCGGWSEFFSDEGSGYWLGRRTLEMCTKQADGRLPRGPLYTIVRDYFSIKDDNEIVGAAEARCTGSREGVASLQMLLHNAAIAGDESAISLYKAAAGEYALMVRGLRGRIELAPGSPVSYAGGLFRAGDVLLEPFKREIAELDMVFAEPLLSPACGALLFAVDRFAPGLLESVRSRLPGFRRSNNSYTPISHHYRAGRNHDMRGVT